MFSLGTVMLTSPSQMLFIFKETTSHKKII